MHFHKLSVAMVSAGMLLAVGACGSGGSSGGGSGATSPGSVVAAGTTVNEIFTPAGLGTASSPAYSAQVVWSNSVGNIVYTVYYSSSSQVVTGLFIVRNGVDWYNGTTPAGYFPSPNNGGVYINTSTKVVTFTNAQVTQNYAGSPVFKINGSLTYQ